MLGGKRNYKAEYARRIAHGLAKGRTRAQSRGHPGPGQPLAKTGTVAAPYNRRLETGFKAIREGKTLTAAAKEIQVSPERLRHYLRGQGIAERRGRQWIALDDKRPRRMLIYTRGEARTVTVDRPAASDIGTYISAVGRFLETNNPAYVAAFADRDVTDIRGVAHPFETDPNTLYHLVNTGDETFEQVYRTVMP
jgi:hypothetical protein